VVWPQNADGKWRLPGERREETSNVEAATSHSPPPRPQPASPPVEAEATVAPVEPEQPPDAGKRTVASKPRKPTTELIPDVQRLAVTGANFRFLDKSGTMVATFGRVDLHASVHDAATLRGNAKIEKVSLRDRLFLDTLQSPLRYDSKQLELSRISARAAGGNVAGAFTINPETHDSPFSVSVKFREVQADQLVVEAGGPSGVVRGKLEGSFEATGKTSDADALSGTGEIALRDGEVQQYSLLVALGQVLQIEELTQLHLQQAQAKYHVSPGLVTIDELVLRSPNIRLSATGTINFNGKLRLDSQLAINEKVRGQLFKAIRENFRPISEAGYSAIDFQVAGTLDHPKTNLMERLVGRDLKDLVNGLFGGKKSDRPKKKKHAEAEPPSTDEASPTPAPEASASPPAP
jgi:type II secretion system protein N